MYTELAIPMLSTSRHGRHWRLLLVPAALAISLGVASVSSCCATPPPQTIVVAACPSNETGVDPDEPFESDTSSEALGLSSPCARACKAFSDLGCPESRKPLGGLTCVQNCKNIQTMSSFDPACVIASKSVSDVRKCPATRCPNPSPKPAPAPAATK